MSIKLYSGKILDTSVLSPWELTDILKENLTPVNIHLTHKAIVTMMVSLMRTDAPFIDRIDNLLLDHKLAEHLKNTTMVFDDMGEEDFFYSTLFLLDTLLSKYEQDEVISRSPDYDLSFSVMMYQTDLLPGKILLYPFAEQQEYLDVLDSIDGVSDYGYWNNTDHPDDVSENEWSERGKQWDDAIGSTGRFSDRGLQWKYSRPYLMGNVEMFSGVVEYIDERIADRIANIDQNVDLYSEYLVSMFDKTVEEARDSVREEQESVIARLGRCKEVFAAILGKGE